VEPQLGSVSSEARIRFKLDCLFKQAELLQSEWDGRLARQAQSLYICATLLAAVIGATATAIGVALSIKADVFNNAIAIELISLPLIFFPWLTTPLAAMFFDDELLMGITEHYLHGKLAVEIRKLLSEKGSAVTNLFDHTLIARFEYRRQLPDCKMSQPRVAAYTRLILFLVPFLIALLAFIVFAYYAFADHSTRKLVFFGVAFTGLASDCWLIYLFFEMKINAGKLWKRIEK
jgi:hypothetical protein